MSQRASIVVVTLLAAGLSLPGLVLGLGNPGRSTARKQVPQGKPTVDREGVISKFLKGSSTAFRRVEHIGQRRGSPPAHLQREPVMPETLTIPAQQATAQLRRAADPRQARDSRNVILRNTHPGLGDRTDFSHLLVVWEQYYHDLSSGEEFEAIDFMGSTDYGATWGDALTWVDPNSLEPIPYRMPSLAYWGKNGSLDRWYAAYCDPRPGNTGRINLDRVETDPNTIMDLTTADWHRVYWDYGAAGFSDMKEPQIACDDRYGDWFWGVISFSIDKSNPSRNDIPAVLSPIDPNGPPTLIYYSSLQDVLGNDVSIDPIGDHTAVVWDPTYESYGHCLLARWQQTNHATVGEAFVWYGAPGYQCYHPVVAAHNSAIIAATETQNVPAGEYVRLMLWKFADGTVGELANEYSFSWDDGHLLYPEIKHVHGDTYVVSCIAQHASDPNDVMVVLAITRDAGVTWDGLYSFSGDEAVKAEYRAVEMPVGGNMGMWEYQNVPGSDDTISLYYSYNAVELNGHVYYPEGDPAMPEEIVVANVDPLGGVVIPMWPNIEGSYYRLKLLLGFDIWTGATIRVRAAQAGLGGYTDQYFDAIGFVNTIDVTYGPYCPGDLNCDGVVDFGDINPFVLYLSNYAGWQAMFPGCYPMNGDISADGLFPSFGDINPFVAEMTEGPAVCQY
jgi:hypothetical protein